MITVLSDRAATARKRHVCDSCLRAIEPGTRYNVQFNVCDGEAYSYREHVQCRAASVIVAATLEWIDSQYGMPRVCDMEEDDRELVAASRPDVAAFCWPSIYSRLSPNPGLFALLNDEQKEAAIAYRGTENNG